jgi:cell division GTPase FtsZ
MNHVKQSVHPDAHIIAGSTNDESLKGKVSVSIVIAGIEDNPTNSSGGLSKLFSWISKFW